MQQPLWWLSFASSDGFLGVALVEADDFISAVRRSHALGINPGGEVKGTLLPGHAAREYRDHANKLLSKSEAQALAKGDG